ncbi:hypothetical protein M1271_03820 [Patescibacteria group bacterium]|nr:hypothetical protein [Patescibacteria group bacterium]MCL5798001.1 hypothetical protein [Patescibacteria group bacterium]
MKRFLAIFILLVFLAIPAKKVFAFQPRVFVTLVNPVRDKYLWQDKEGLVKEASIVVSLKVNSTWLVQYGNLKDKSVTDILKNLPSGQEVGLLLEVDENLATDSQVPYLIGAGDWARPDKVFLSGYTPFERERMIDVAFEKFRQVFGYYPKSVGAWYIDAVSLNYMSQKYKISAVLDCSDQYHTDKYGLWGQPWGTPYSPSKLNPLTPASRNGGLPLVVLQWAQRDPVRGYGMTVNNSTYSVQANDYISHGLNTSYFGYLARQYLFADNGLNQLTIGLETGMESVKYGDELKRQIQYLLSYKSGAQVVFSTMGDFASIFDKVQKNSDYSYFIESADYKNKGQHAYWYTSAYYRAGLLLDGDKLILRDLKTYGSNYTFSDIAAGDVSTVLKRFMPSCVDEAQNKNSLTLLSYITGIKSKREGSGIKLEVTGGQPGLEKKNILELKKEGVFLDGKEIFTTSMNYSIGEKLNNWLKQLVFAHYIGSYHKFSGGLRFADVGNVKYFGLMIGSDKLFGIKSTSPFFGEFSFPFQTLVRFRALPLIDPYRVLSGYLVNEANKCRIKLSE